MFELFEHSKYMMIYTRKGGNLWNFGSFTNFKIYYFSKLYLKNFRIFQNKNFQIFGIPQIWHSLNWQFLELSKLTNF